MIFVTSKTSDGNMDFRFGEYKKVLENRKKFFNKLGVKNIVEVKQIHDNNVVLIENIVDPDTAADGMVTNHNIYLMLRIADCIPIGLYDPTHQALGLVHAGSKGLEKSIIKNVLNQMKKNFKTNPKDLIVNFGPSIGPCHYKMDLWTEAEKQLSEYGVLEKNIDNPKICTYESKDYFSHRRSQDFKTEGGRFVTILGF